MNTSVPSADLIDLLPGVSLPVAAVPEALSTMWDPAPGSDTEGAPSAFRASQMNLILHFGLKTSPEEARERFDTAIAFGQLYPCRIIILCPSVAVGDQNEPMRAKLFSQCYIGASHREMCCCEALMLGYHTIDGKFLEDQVSVWLEGDLPVYYWLHRVPSPAIAERYLPFLHTCRRVVYDSALDGVEMEGLPWKRDRMLSDLAWARILPLRQSLGQFLSGFAPELLIDGFRSFTVRASAERLNEARNLACWLAGGLGDCLKMVDAVPIPPFQYENLPVSSQSIEIEWHYSDAQKYFRWRHNAASNISIISASFSGKAIEMPAPIRSLTPAESLAEAFFF